MKYEDLTNKRVAILGLKVEGIGLANFLADKVKSVTIFDRKNLDQLEADVDFELFSEIQKVLELPNIENRLGLNFPENPGDFDIIFRSPAFYYDDELLKDAKGQGVIVSTQMQLFFDLCPAKIIGVTGTKGKGTTASLIFEILKKNYQLSIINYQTNSNTPNTNNQQLETNVYLGGNIGYEVLGLLNKLKPEDIVVLELSNFQLADLSRSPHIAVVTNLGVDHLDYHKTLEEYHKTKEAICRYQTSDNYAVLNLNSTFKQGFVDTVRSKILYFSKTSSETDAYVGEEDDPAVYLNYEGVSTELVRSSELKLVGRHNLENIAAASLVANILNVPLNTIKETVRNFTGLPHRLELVAEIGSVRYINDSFATNPGPTMAAIESFVEPKIMIFGGSSKGADFSEMAVIAKENNVKAVVLIGKEGEKIGEALRSVNFPGIVTSVYYDLKQAIQAAKDMANSGDIIIFSPACASFDMFKNYKDRGDKFRKIVQEISND